MAPHPPTQMESDCTGSESGDPQSSTDNDSPADAASQSEDPINARGENDKKELETPEDLPATPPVAIDLNDSLWLEELHRLETCITSGFETLSRQFEQKLAFDFTKQQQIDSLHTQVQEYRTDLIARTNRPLVNGLIRLYSDIDKRTVKWRAEADKLTPERLFKFLDEIKDDIEIFLDHNGVSLFTENETQFDPRRQRVLIKEPSTDESLEGTIAKRLRPGFEQGNEILQKEHVAVFVYTPDAKSHLQGDDNEEGGMDNAHSTPGNLGNLEGNNG